MKYHHVSVMLEECLFYLRPGPGKVIVDCTLGGAGHALAIAERIMPGGLLIGIDLDMDAIRNGRSVLAKYSDNVHLFHGNFDEFQGILDEMELSEVDGFLVDLGISLHQIESGGRGFSFTRSEPLDMRMNPDIGIPARDVVNSYSEAELRNIFHSYGEERWAGRIAGRIVKRRKQKPFLMSDDLADVVLRAIPKKKGRGFQRIHPATRVFMAIRIAVNDELGNIERFFDRVCDALRPGGRLCVLTFHSLEDRIVKRRMREYAKGCICPPRLPKCVCGHERKLRVLTKKAIFPGENEVRQNPPSRSAKLRVAEKV